MNKQVAYITQAHLILVALAAGFWIFSKIPFSGADQTQQTSVTASVNNSIGLSSGAIKGKSLFMSKCASCHSLFRIVEGPKLGEVLNNEFWSDRKKLYKWIRNPAEFMKNEVRMQELRRMYNTVMPAFPSMTDEEIDAIVSYISEAGKQ